MRVCYFVSEYPAVSHTFIRREIVELERNNITVLRVSLRRNDREQRRLAAAYDRRVEAGLPRADREAAGRDGALLVEGQIPSQMMGSGRNIEPLAGHGSF